MTLQRPVALLNAGSTTAVDNFLEDRFSFGNTYTGSIANAIDLGGVTDPAPQSVYQSYRYTNTGTAGVGFGYQLPVPDGTYTIRLHFQDPSYSGSNQRKFDIKLQDVLVQDEFDVAATAGGQYKAVALSFTVTASGGNGIKLELINGSTGIYNNTAFICGIELGAANPLGMAAPTVNLELSADGGANWSPLANDLTMDRFGRGSYLWTIPGGQAAGSQYRIRAVANGAVGVNDASDENFLIANNGMDYYVNDASTVGDVFTTAVGRQRRQRKIPRPAHGQPLGPAYRLRPRSRRRHPRGYRHLQLDS